MDWERIGLCLIGLAVAGSFAYVLTGEPDEASKRGEDADGAYVTAEGSQTSTAEQCAAATQALDVVAARGRADLAETRNGVAGCRRIEVEDCEYKVELLYELTQADRTALAQEVGRIGTDCSRELEFAVKHGLPAFRDHYKLLTEAVEETLDEGQ